MEPLKGKQGAELLDSVNNTYWDPLRYKKWADTDEEARKYLVDHNIRIHEDAEDVYNFFSSYLNSKGYLRILDNQWDSYKRMHPYRKFITTKYEGTTSPSWYDPSKSLNYWMDLDTEAKKLRGYLNIYRMDGYPTMSFHAGPGTFVYKYPKRSDGTYPQDEEYPDNFILGHEFAHRYPQWFERNIEMLKRNTNTKPGHDSNSIEKHSDIWGLKYLLYKEGIYDSRQDKDATPAHIEKLRKKYPLLRPLKQMDNEKTAWMLNNVTSNLNNKALTPRQREV